MGTNLRIRELRKEAGLTLEQLADKVGLTAPHLSEMERGIKNVSTIRLEQLANALDRDTAELLASDGEAQQLVSIMKKLNETDRLAVLRHASGLLRDQQADS